MRQYSPSTTERIRLTQHLREITDSAHQLHHSLPDSFLQVMASLDLQDRIPSCTACYFDLSDEIIPYPGSKDGYLIRFLNDQQVVLLWYLYLTPAGEHCVLVSRYWFDILDESPAKFRAAPEYTFVCSPSFETFLYRFWLENTIWYKLNWYGLKPLSEEEKRYLSYYQS